MSDPQSQTPPTHRQPLSCRFKEMLRLNRGLDCLSPRIMKRYRDLTDREPVTAFKGCGHGGLWKRWSNEENEVAKRVWYRNVTSHTVIV
ncbi:hypothetical protein GJ744_006386 [Endocarpon pusillum]|uniref:Uncharacterized protein n=1 Tax=Endocarpon pusillum TaxID=364733 RepID=A0A8H7AK21_9EURO|nr:hypothetical protein GJ744_006386 [Endocarpon pusillum]